jgi:hypothetical protein
METHLDTHTDREQTRALKAVSLKLNGRNLNG